MGKSYYVPRSVKGESRILYIFSIKSVVTTAAFALIGGLIWYLGGKIGMSIFWGLGITVFFGAIGYIIGAAKIPDSKYVGVFRKAGGEYLSDIIIRFITFKNKKKIYLYNYNRYNYNSNKGGNTK